MPTAQLLARYAYRTTLKKDLNRKYYVDMWIYEYDLDIFIRACLGHCVIRRDSSESGAVKCKVRGMPCLQSYTAP